MSDNSAIEWTDATWNPVRGCSRVSEGCRHCYAEGVAARFSRPGAPYEGLARFTPGGPRWTGKIRLVPEVLEEPLRWRKPRKIFVNSMSDLFHPDVPDLFILQVFNVIREAHDRGHVFQLLTKRPERMASFCRRLRFDSGSLDSGRAGGMYLVDGPEVGDVVRDLERPIPGYGFSMVMRDLWLGVSVEDQDAADERIPHLLATPAAVRFLSCEPLLGPVDLEGALRYHGSLGWIIVGGESGRGARELDLAWIRALVQQGRADHVPVFVKQLGAAWARSSEHYPLGDAKGGDPQEWPADLRVREWPEAR